MAYKLELDQQGFFILGWSRREGNRKCEKQAFVTHWVSVMFLFLVLLYFRCVLLGRLPFYEYIITYHYSMDKIPFLKCQF